MDLEEWELLPKTNYKGLDLDLDLGHEEDHEVTKMMKNAGKSFDSDYFICPIQDSVEKTELLHQRSSVVPTQLLQIPITWEPLSPVVMQRSHKRFVSRRFAEICRDICRVIVEYILFPLLNCIDTKINCIRRRDQVECLVYIVKLFSSIDTQKILQALSVCSPVDDKDHNKHLDPNLSEPDPEPLTESLPSPRITFKKMKETEFADMKIDSPTRLTSPLPQNDDYDEIMGSEVEEGSDLKSKKEVDWDEGERMNLWKKGLNGIGAICSFGVAAAAATICVFFLGHNNNIQGCRNKNQILRFQIYSDDNKRMNEVVKHATKLNEAISVMKGLPVARAQISFGGYYDAI